jgi:hypothetical protein
MKTQSEFKNVSIMKFIGHENNLLPSLLSSYDFSQLLFSSFFSIFFLLRKNRVKKLNSLFYVIEIFFLLFLFIIIDE